MITPSTPPPELPLERPAYVQQQESPYKQFDDAIAEDPSSPTQRSEDCEPTENNDISAIEKAGERIKEAKEGVYDPLEALADGKREKDKRKREDDTAEQSRNKERSTAGAGPDPEPVDARQCDLSNQDLAQELADSHGLSLAPDVANDYRVNTSPYADLAQDLSDRPGESSDDDGNDDGGGRC